MPTEIVSESYTSKLLAKAVSKGSVNKDFYGAALIAHNSNKHDGFEPSENNLGELEYTLQQGLKAACHAREDTAAILIIQKSILERLETLKFIASLCFFLLCYIAYHIS